MLYFRQAKYCISDYKKEIFVALFSEYFHGLAGCSEFQCGQFNGQVR